MKPRVLVLRAAGSNCDNETRIAFDTAGGRADLVHINRVLGGEIKLSAYQILAIPGGFTYGDDVSAGKILANELRFKLMDELQQFHQKGKLIIGICNGFQVLIKAGLLPEVNFLGQNVTLTTNDSGKFEDRWTYLQTNRCIWTKGIKKIIYLPVAHGEGKFIPENDKILKSLRRNGQIVFQYVDEKGRPAGYPDNPNGSVDGIAGICDPTGRVLGMMPHPERHVVGTQHPRWTREGLKRFGDGLTIFKNGVNHIKKHLT